MQNKIFCEDSLLTCSGQRWNLCLPPGYTVASGQGLPLLGSFIALLSAIKPHQKTFTLLPNA
jgi:hypothetical protein